MVTGLTEFPRTTSEWTSPEECPSIVNGRWSDVGHTCVPVLDDGFLRGDGAFEVVRLYAGRPFALDRHIARLKASCAQIRLACDGDETSTEALDLAEAAHRRTCDMRIVLTRAGLRLLILEPLRPADASARLAVITDSAPILMSGAKTLSYAGKMLASRISIERHCTDALFVTPDGRVLESQTAAFFWVDSEGRLCTPPLSEGILDSITRGVVLSRLEVDERPCGLAEALSCNEAFLAGTTREVQPVERIEGRSLGHVPGSSTQRATEAFWAEVEETTGFKREP